MPRSAWVLVAANLVPLAGVLFWGWEVFPLLVLFWLENLVIGALNALRMLLVAPRDRAAWAAKLATVPFFCAHYGVFALIHGAIVFTLFGGRAYEPKDLWLLEPALRALRDYDLWLPLAALAASHLFSLAWNDLYRGELRGASLQDLMGRPYKRVVVLHLAIIAGGFGVQALHSPAWALAALVGLKIFIDVAAHRKEHAGQEDRNP